MDTTKRKQEIIEYLNLDKNELKEIPEGRYYTQSFKSIEYYLILHFCNEELYYMSEEEEESFSHCDEIIDTELGRIYALK